MYRIGGIGLGLYASDDVCDGLYGLFASGGTWSETGFWEDVASIGMYLYPCVLYSEFCDHAGLFTSDIRN